VLEVLREGAGRRARVLALMPNVDAGRDGIVRAIQAEIRDGASVRVESHLAREQFVGLLKRFACWEEGKTGVVGNQSGGHAGLLIGNSSAGLIEAAAIGVPVVNIGGRQGGRERCENVVHAPFAMRDAIAGAIDRARGLDLRAMSHPYGDGTSGVRIASVLASVNGLDGAMLRKRCAY